MMNVERAIKNEIENTVRLAAIYREADIEEFAAVTEQVGDRLRLELAKLREKKAERGTK